MFVNLNNLDNKMFESFGLIYSEIRENLKPEVQASYPKYSEEIEKVILLRSLPYKNVLKDLFTVYQIDADLIGISYFKYFTRARTLSGSQVACLTWLSNVAINPFQLKPFLELVTISLLRVVVDEKLMKTMVKEITQTKGILKTTTKSKGTPITFSAGIPNEGKLPELFYDLDKKLSKI